MTIISLRVQGRQCLRRLALLDSYMKLKRTIGKNTVVSRLRWNNKKGDAKAEPVINQGTGVLLKGLPSANRLLLLTAAHCAYAGPVDKYQAGFSLSNQIEIESLSGEQKTVSSQAIPVEDRDLALLVLEGLQEWPSLTTRIVFLTRPPEYHVLLGVYGVPGFLEEKYARQVRLRDIEGCTMDDMELEDHEFYVETKRRSESQHKFVGGMSGGGVFVTHFKEEAEKEFLSLDQLVENTLFMVGTVTEVIEGPEDLKCESVDSLEGLSLLDGMEFWGEEKFMTYMKERLLIREVACLVLELCNRFEGDDRAIYNLLNQLRGRLQEMVKRFGNPTTEFATQLHIAEGHSIATVKVHLGPAEIRDFDHGLLWGLKQIAKSYISSPGWKAFSSSIVNLLRNE